ncbi:Chemotaxis protein CheY [Fuerstiella marisgermanici]|uniref:Chemotaxis protein CheY n=2 Tax=Fuerstiella marisgermanici TaxID=1891926 RepID=A0A1P8WAD0_9PLAN|nr:Chemotaxis protein CheY [Fuerstiella marisgermanici]
MTVLAISQEFEGLSAMESFRSPTVLIVDDDRDVRLGTRLRLQAAGYRTLEAENGLLGIAAAIEHSPDLVLLDVRMPTMDGLTALKLLRNNEITKNTPIIMLSASHVDQTEALDSGARFFLAKPYHGPQMLAAVEAAIVA